MNSWLIKLFGWLRRARPRILCNEAIWTAGIKELAKRTRGASRESGAFLLGVDDGKTKHILEFAFYDDLDPHALDLGYVHFSGTSYSKLWDWCRARGYGVVADVHVHPGGYGQSSSDKDEPAMPRAGHIAFIIPNFARHGTTPGLIGQYEYLGEGLWKNHTAEGERFFTLVR